MKTQDCFPTYTILPIALLCIVFAAGALPAQTTYREIELKGEGKIVGTVRLVSVWQPAEVFEITKDTEHCGIRKPSDRLILGKNNGVKNAIISIEGISEGKKFQQFAQPVLDQRNCEYVPHVQIIPIGSQLHILNSDEILHNVHGYTVEDNPRTVFNIAQPIKGQRTTIKHRQLSKAGSILMTCDAGHPWMTAYTVIAEHPYYTISDENGNFELSDVPVGTHKLKMWYEGFRIVGKELERGVVKKYHFEDPYIIVQSITIGPNEKVRSDFEIALRQ